MSHHRHTLHSRPSRFQRVAAWLGVALMFVLALGAASPQFHAWFHAGEHSHCQGELAILKSHAHASHHEHDAASRAHPLPPAGNAPWQAQDDDGCVITIFSHGIVSLSMALALLAEIDAIQPAHQVAIDWIIPAAPRYAWLRTHAPPTA